MHWMSDEIGEYPTTPGIEGRLLQVLYPVLDGSESYLVYDHQQVDVAEMGVALVFKEGAAFITWRSLGYHPGLHCEFGASLDEHVRVLGTSRLLDVSARTKWDLVLGQRLMRLRWENIQKPHCKSDFEGCPGQVVLDFEIADVAILLGDEPIPGSGVYEYSCESLLVRHGD